MSVGDLPVELIDYIFSFLDSEPPSVRRVHEWPTGDIAGGDDQSLKPLSLTSHFLRQLVLHRLFTHCRIELSRLNPFLGFINRHGLNNHVKSLVVLKESNWSNAQHPAWWARILAVIDPGTLTIIAPPYQYAELSGCSLVDFDNWAFHMPFQILQLKQSRKQHMMSHGVSSSSLEKTAEDNNNNNNNNDNLFNARPWTELLVNEGSFLKAYSSYEYFHRSVPSLMSTFAKRSLCPATAISRLTSFHFTAIFPFYNHVDTVLKLVRNVMMLESFSVKLAPDPDSPVIELEQIQGRINLADAWMELNVAYELICHTVMTLGASSSLVRFRSLDFDGREAIRESLEKKMNDRLDGMWTYRERGIWVRESSTS